MSTRSRNTSSSKKSTESSSGEFYPHLGDMPSLPPVDYAALGQEAPSVLETPNGAVATWAILAS